MKAALHRSYGPPDVIQIDAVEKPVPSAHEVLIRVRAAGLNPLDWRLMRGGPVIRALSGVRAPRDPRLGRDVAGDVEAVGRNVERLKPGDAVFGTFLGAAAQYACASENTLTTKPDKVTFEQAASIPIAGITALQSLRDQAKIQPGQKVLINGAAAGSGTRNDSSREPANWTWYASLRSTRHGAYVGERDQSTCLKIRNPRYSQIVGRAELFQRDRHREPVPGWHSCELACGENPSHFR